MKPRHALVTSHLRLDEPERARLREGAAALGVTLEADALERFAEYAALLDVWAPRTNLISCTDGHELVERHFLDSLVLAEMTGGAERIVDLGSGAGFPGVPLAIAFPAKRVILVEPRHRRASFLREVRRKIVPGVEVLVQRADAVVPPRAVSDIVVSRAVWSDEAILDAAEPWLRGSGILLWMRGADAVPPRARDRGLRWRESRPYVVDGSHRGRVEIFERVATAE